MGDSRENEKNSREIQLLREKLDHLKLDMADYGASIIGLGLVIHFLRGYSATSHYHFFTPLWVGAIKMRLLK